MQGLIARTLQNFLQDTYGHSEWLDIAAYSGLEATEFEAMLDYDIELVQAVLTCAETRLSKPPEVIFEDIGTYLVTHPNNETLRRLLRYGGEDFFDFLHSLEDLPGRAQLAMADLRLPDLELRDFSDNQFCLRCLCTERWMQGFGHVLVGVLRSMADDYGALVLLDHRGRHAGTELIDITVIEMDYAEGRDFQLGGPTDRKRGVAS